MDSAAHDTVRITTEPCSVHGKHMPASHINERHHIWPQGRGGPTVPENLVVICATGHNNVHSLLSQYLVLNGVVPYSVLKQFAVGERKLAKLGYERITRNAL